MNKKLLSIFLFAFLAISTIAQAVTVPPWWMIEQSLASASADGSISSNTVRSQLGVAKLGGDSAQNFQGAVATFTNVVVTGAFNGVTYTFYSGSTPDSNWMTLFSVEANITYEISGRIGIGDHNAGTFYAILGKASGTSTAQVLTILVGDATYMQLSGGNLQIKSNDTWGHDYSAGYYFTVRKF